MAGELKGFSLASLKQDNPFIKLIQRTLNSYLKTANQKVESIDIQKVKRPSGVSVVPVDFVLTGQQTLTLLLRADGDVYRAQINGKDYPFTGVLNPDSSDLFGKAIKELVSGIIKGQVAYTKKLEKESSSILQPKINANRTPPKNVNQQIKANADEELQLDNEIEKLAAERDALKAKLEGVGQSELGKFDGFDSAKNSLGVGFSPIHAMADVDSGKGSKSILSAPKNMPSSALISTLENAESYWNANFKGKTFALDVHSRKGEYEPIRIAVYFGNTNHAYTEKPHGASHHKAERVLSQDRAKNLDKIITTIQNPHAKLISKGNDLLIAAPIHGEQYTVALSWSEARNVYDFESAHFKTEKQIAGIRNSQRNEKMNKNKGSLQK